MLPAASNIIYSPDNTVPPGGKSQNNKPALKEYHYLTQNLAGAQKFDNDEALLTYIQGRLTMLEVRAVDSGTQPQADPVWSWQRIKQDVLAFVKGGCNGNGILAGCCAPHWSWLRAQRYICSPNAWRTNFPSSPWPFAVLTRIGVNMLIIF